ncbi:MAG: M23 family metallopeptidase [Saprospiraceae bacterium]|nr:M23 family metallopeptidase [Saprospiraceae bacterium]
MFNFSAHPCVFFLLITTSLWGQELNIQVYNQQIGQDEIIVYGDNEEYFPVSVQIELELKGMQTSHKNGDVIILHPRQKKQHLISLKPVAGKSWSYLTSVKSYFGDIRSLDYDTNYHYQLPFEQGTSQLISQGYLGRISHHNEYALDFDMEEGSSVYAIRDGTVVKVIDKHNRSCPDVSCMQYNNLVTVQHEDGTYADYAHLKKNSARVSLGEVVLVGTHLADSGNTGWTTGPHLHLVVYKPAIQKRKTIPTLFKIGDQESALLEAGKTYRRY